MMDRRDVGNFTVLDFGRCPTPESICHILRSTGTDTSEAKFHGICRVYWDVLKFCELELNPEAQLHNVVTVTGTPTLAEADSCEDFVKKRWQSTDFIDSLVTFMKEPMKAQGKSPLYRDITKVQIG
jgi:hypothetical protein